MAAAGSNTRPRSSVALVVTVLALLAVLVPGATASAHTDFESSLPADGTTVDTPVSEIIISFTAAAEPAGDGFQALTADGVVREPTTITVEQDRVFRLGFDPPLAGGTVGVRWNVRAGDAHPISGSFSFTVTAPAPTTAPATTTPATTTPPATAAPATTAAGQPDDGAIVGGDASGSPTTAVATANSTAAVIEAADEAADLAANSPSLEEFLAVDEQPDGAGVARVGRLIGFSGVVLGLGALAIAGSVLIGTRREVSTLLRAVRVLGAVIAIGAIVEYVGVTRLLDESLGGTWSTQAGVATVLRVVGGIAIAIGVRSTIAGPRSPAPLSADVAVGTAPSQEAHSTPASPERARWRPGRRSWPAAIGVGAVLVSFWFDGHTATKGFRPLHAVVDTVHVAAGSVWVGGVVTLAAIAVARHRQGQPRRFGELMVRFSSLATVSLIAVAVAGVVMTSMITESLGDLTDTEWGQLLLLKLGAVALATAFGAFHHFRLRPALEVEPDDGDLLVAARNTLVAEAVVLAFVVVVTVWLVAAAT